MHDVTQLEMKLKIDKSWPHPKKSIKCCNYYSAMFNGFHLSIFFRKLWIEICLDVTNSQNQDQRKYENIREMKNYSKMKKALLE